MVYKLLAQGRKLNKQGGLNKSELVGISFEKNKRGDIYQGPESNGNKVKVK